MSNQITPFPTNDSKSIKYLDENHKHGLRNSSYNESQNSYLPDEKQQKQKDPYYFTFFNENNSLQNKEVTTIQSAESPVQQRVFNVQQQDENTFDSYQH